jgi:hypothetical protein
VVPDVGPPAHDDFPVMDDDPSLSSVESTDTQDLMRETGDQVYTEMEEEQFLLSLVFIEDDGGGEEDHNKGGVRQKGRRDELTSNDRALAEIYQFALKHGGTSLQFIDSLFRLLKQHIKGGFEVEKVPAAQLS